MNAPEQACPRASSRKAEPDRHGYKADASVRHQHRDRDYGIGYGNSSGYGSERHFTDGHADPLFRLG